MATPHDAPDSLSGILDRVDLILDAIATEGSMNLTQISRTTLLPRTTVHRLLEQMTRRRWVTRIRNDYEIGVRPFHLGTIARQGHWFFRIARPHLETVRERTRLVVHLGYLDGTDVVWWDKVGDARPSVVPTYVGGRHPAFRTAAGRALLATEPDDYLTDHFPLQLDRTTRESLQTRASLASTGNSFPICPTSRSPSPSDRWPPVTDTRPPSPSRCSAPRSGSVWTPRCPRHSGPAHSTSWPTSPTLPERHGTRNFPTTGNRPS